MSEAIAAAPPGRSFLRKLVGNTAIGFAGSTLQKGLTFATTLVLARGLGDVGFGLYSYVVAYMFFFSFVADLGMERVVAREIARTPGRAGTLLGTALAVKLGLSLLALVLAVSLSFWLGMPAETRYCIFLAALGLPLSIELVLRGYFQSRYEVKYSFSATLPAVVAFLLFSIVVTSLGWPVHTLFYGALGIGICTLSWLLRKAHGQARITIRWDYREAMALLRDAWELGLFVVLFMLAARIDQVMLYHLRSVQEVGLYAGAVRISEALSIIPEALVVTVFPLLASSERFYPERFHHTYRLSFKYLAALIIPIALGLTWGRTDIVVFLFGPSYAGAAGALAILAWNSLFAYAGAVYLSLFIAQTRQRLLLLVSGIAVVVNVGVNLLWIPSYGPSGAAAATVLANAVGFLCWLVVPVTRPYMLVCLSETWRALLAGAAVCLAVWLLGLGLLASLAVLAAGYPVLLWIIGGAAWSDVSLARHLFAHEEQPTA